MEERLKSLMQDLGNAINESLSDSERIAEAIGEIKRAGYDVFLVLEATIGFNKRDDDDEARNRCAGAAGNCDEGKVVYHSGSAFPESAPHRRRRRSLEKNEGKPFSSAVHGKHRAFDSLQPAM